MASTDGVRRLLAAAQGYMVAAVFHADNRYSPVRIEVWTELAPGGRDPSRKRGAR